MFGIITGLFAGLLLYYNKKWTSEKEEENWDFWEECEDLRDNMGHTTDIVKIPRRRAPASRKKHRH